MSTTKSLIIAFVLIGSSFAYGQGENQDEQQDMSQISASNCPLRQIRSDEGQIVRVETSPTRYVIKSPRNQ